MNAAGLSLDIDWAPDFVIDAVAERLAAANVRATWFVTHASPAIDRLREKNDLFELGIHPNFLPGSTHGESSSQVLTHCFDIVPDAVSMRSHALFLHSRLIEEIIESTRIRVDSNIFLPYARNIEPFPYKTRHGSILRVPFRWADDYVLTCGSRSWGLDPDEDINGPNVFMFHPIHVYLNTHEPGMTEKLRRAAPRLQDAAAADLAPLVHDGEGAASAFGQLVSRLAASGGGVLMRDFL